MITSLRVRNFKSWSDSGMLDLGRLTGFFGSNSSGKTSLLQLLLMLKQTSESADRSQVLHLGDDRTLVGLGVLRDVLHEHSEEAALEWCMAWNLAHEIEVKDPDEPKRIALAADRLSFSAKIAADGENGQGRVQRMAYGFAGHEFSYEARGPKRSEGYNLLADGSEDFFRRGRGRPRTGLPAPVRSYGFPDEVRTGFQNAGFLSDLELAFERLMRRVTYLGPLRDYPRRQYTWAGDQPEDMGRRGERWVNALLASDPKRRKHWGNRTLEEHVAWWLQKLGLIHSFSVKPVTKDSNLYRVRVRTTPKASEVLITDVGFGVSQVLPVIVLCFYAPKGSIVILEQPEIHLHPSVQAGLADVLVDAIRKRGIQVILESHSEYLLRRLQRRIAEEAIGHDETALYFCHLDKGRSVAERLRVNLFGYIENWPEGFFGDQMEEVAQMTAAAKRRREGS